MGSSRFAAYWRYSVSSASEVRSFTPVRSARWVIPCTDLVFLVDLLRGGLQQWSVRFAPADLVEELVEGPADGLAAPFRQVGEEVFE